MATNEAQLQLFEALEAHTFELHQAPIGSFLIAGLRPFGCF